ncbi:MAG: gliding motility-associated C-terminal domain-containing protein, partial [Bacteroidetes bacterium]|nr:gliding motility-associated C-terminal domain-containing protein [Bacteroidota bacterium]
ALCPGDYVVEVTNGDGCITIDTATVVAPPGLTAAISSVPVTCANACDGEATIGLSGGIGPFTITWSPAPGAGQGTPHVTGLCPGPYDILVHDLGGCDTTFSVLITAPDTITVDAVVSDISCNGLCDGSITLTPQGGTGVFSYLWSPLPPNGQGTNTATDLCAGSYAVTVSDANGCDTTLTFTIQEPSAIVLTPSTSLSHCTVCDGSITLGVSGGTGTVGITWTDPGGATVGTGPALTGLCAGLYTANAVDDNGCTASVTVAITDATGEALTMTNGRTLCANACDAQVGVTFICSAAPCSITWYDAGANIIAQDQFAVGGLCVGTYVVQVTNGAGCSTIDTAFVTPSQTIIPNLSSTPVTCAGACDGSATVGPVGGVEPYTYTWVPAPGGGQGTPQATGLCPGTYGVLIADASGCDTLVSVLILSPPRIQVDAQLSDVACNGACDGSIVLTPSGGSGFFGFSWSPVPPNGQGSNGAFDLCAGDWTVTITDVNGCDTTITYTIAEPPPLVLAITSTPSNCGVCTGTASVQPAGGTAPYLYSWTLGGLIHGTDSALTDLCAGLYTVTVTDANNCTAQLQVPISDADGETVTTTDDLLNCPGLCDGEVSASFICGAPACTVAWYDALGNDLNEPSTTLSGLCAGIYYVQVTNGVGCLTIDTARVDEPTPIAANLSTTPVTCAGSCDGTATVGPTGGAGGYTYDWQPPPGGGQGTPNATGLCAGTYQVTITDALGCSLVQSVLITGPAPIDATAVLGMITCNGACDGSITVTPTGGNGGFTFLWSPEPATGQGTNTVTGLCAGDWDLTLTDVNGCDTTFTITLTDPPVLTVDLTTTGNVCFGDCAGTASVAIGGGGAPYGLIWTDPTGDTLAVDVTAVTGLCAGDHLLEVTDAHGCVRTLPFTIGGGVAIDPGLVFLGETCNGPCDGTATVSPTGGSGSGYTILWQPAPPSGQGTNTVTGLCAGDWSVTITDDAGCDTTVAFTITNYARIEMNGNILNPACNAACDGSIDLTIVGGVGALTMAWTPAPPTGQGTPTITGLCAGDWSITVTDAAGCDTTVTITLTDPPAIVITTDAVVDASCNTANDGSIAVTITGGAAPYDVSWTGPNGFTSGDEDITGLAPGVYTITVTDANGCQVSQAITVGALSSVVADAGADRTECSGVAFTLDGSASQGAVTYEWRNEQGDLLGTTPTIDIGGLPPGTHDFTLTVGDGPCTDTDVITITVLPSPVADAGPDHTLFVEGTVTIGGQPSGPTGSIFSWTPDTLLNDPAAANPTATVHRTTWFVLTVQDPNGCVDVDSVLITVVPEVVIPSGFTPNGDGHNDTWQIDFIELFPDCEVEIYNRWGEPLFRSVGYHQPWDGRYNGGFVPVGTYYYAIKLNDPRFPNAFTGPLTVIR